MNDPDLQEKSRELSSPYGTTRHRLGVTSKIFSERFVCTPHRLHTLHEIVSEKLLTLRNHTSSFRYLVSFDDRTHREHHDLRDLEAQLSSSPKHTDRLVLKWTTTYELDGELTEGTVIVRMTNPINPLMYLQAALSKSPEDIDNYEFEDGTVAVSADGVSPVFAQEIFEQVGSWIAASPTPESTSLTNDFVYNHRGLVQFSNYWIFPALATIGFSFYLLSLTSIEIIGPLVFSGIVAHNYLRTFALRLNNKIDHWCRKSRMLSIFHLTGGDANKQNRYAAHARTSTTKLLISAVAAFTLDIAAGIVLYVIT